MPDPKTWSSRVTAANPVYVLSAMVMMGAIAVLLRGSQPAAGDVFHILLTYGSLQLYELAVVALAVWITVRLIVPEDAGTLLLIESILLGLAFITLDELLSANTAWGMGVYAAGLTLAAGKLAITAHPLKIPIGRTVRCFVWFSLALPLAWVPTMKSFVSIPELADLTAHLAWWSLGWLIFVGVVAVWFTRRCSTGAASQLPSILLVVGTVLTVGAHLFSLHHSFLAEPRLANVSPVIVSVSFAIVLAVLGNGRPVTRWSFVVSFLPCVGLLPLWLGTPQHAQGHDPLGQALVWVGWHVLGVYICLLLMTKRKWFLLHLFVVPALVFADYRRAVGDHLWEHLGWWLAGLAFALLAVGMLLSLYKHRYRVSDQQ